MYLKDRFIVSFVGRNFLCTYNRGVNWYLWALASLFTGGKAIWPSLKSEEIHLTLSKSKNSQREPNMFLSPLTSLGKVKQG